jgi:hypothetical protein
MFTKIEKLGDRLLRFVVPQARASASACTCAYIGDCDVSRIRWKCCNMSGCYTTCNYRNPCGS